MASRQDWIKAGSIASEVREYSKTLIKPGAKLLDIANKIEDKIRELGAVPAFPVNLSSNEVAAHYTPAYNDETVLDKQVLKTDIGVCYNGAIGDTAYTIDLSGKYGKLVEASKAACEAAIKACRIGATLGEIGRAIEETIKGYGFNPIKNLSGHGLSEYNIHDEPSIPNYDNGSEAKLKKGDIIAIEPFATNGGGRIREGSYPEIYCEISDKPIRDINARKIFEEIRKFKDLPFSTRDLVKKFPPPKVLLALRRLRLNNNLESYAPLPEASGGIVSQHEESLLIDDEVVVLTKVLEVKPKSL